MPRVPKMITVRGLYDAFSTLSDEASKARSPVRRYDVRMLGANDIMAFVPTTDFDKARAFYEGTLGLRYVKNDGFAMVLEANGVFIRVTKTPDHKPLPYTILGWRVPDIDSTVDGLMQRGVQFERYGFPGQDERGVWTAPGGDRVAWFKDPDGNTLSVSQHVSD